MSGVEVAAIVASILAAFSSGMDMFKRMRAKQKTRKHDKQGGKLTQEELRLQQSLSCGHQQIRAEYDKNVIRLGQRFKVGDTTAQTSLAHILLVLNTSLANIIHHALSEDSRAREMSKRSLLGLSELAAADTLNTLGQLNKRLTSVASPMIQTQLHHRMPHRRKRRAQKEKDQTLPVSRINSAERKEKKRPGPDPLARGGWVRSKSGTSVVSSGSSTPRLAKQTSNHSSFSLPIDASLSQFGPTAREVHRPYDGLPCTCGAHVPAPRYELDINKHHSHLNVAPKLHETDLLLASPDVFDIDFPPPRPPKIPIERPTSNKKPRPPSVATFLTASTKIGEIPEHRWLDRPWDNRPLPYVIPPPLEPGPAKRRARGFKAWWKNHGRDDEDARKERRRYKLLGNDTVDIYVGAERKKWTVHKKLICTRVPCFDKAFQGSFQEATDQSICLTEADPTGFEVFLSWLYRDSLVGVMPENILVDEEDVEHYVDCVLDHATTIKLVEFLIQTEKFLLPAEVKTAALDNLVQLGRLKCGHGSIPMTIVTRVLDAASADSPFRTLIFDVLCFDLRDECRGRT